MHIGSHGYSTLALPGWQHCGQLARRASNGTLLIEWQRVENLLCWFHIPTDAPSRTLARGTTDTLCRAPVFKLPGAAPSLADQCHHTHCAHGVCKTAPKLAVLSGRSLSCCRSRQPEGWHPCSLHNAAGPSIGCITWAINYHASKHSKTAGKVRTHVRGKQPCSLHKIGVLQIAHQAVTGPSTGQAWVPTSAVNTGAMCGHRVWTTGLATKAHRV